MERTEILRVFCDSGDRKRSFILNEKYSTSTMHLPNLANEVQCDLKKNFLDRVGASYIYLVREGP